MDLQCGLFIGFSVIFEVCGLGLVAWQLTRVQRREFGTPEWVRRLRARWLRLLGRKPPTQVVELSGISSGESAGALSLRVSPPSGANVEQRVACLETNFEELERALQRQEEEVADGVSALGRRIDDLRADLNHQHQQGEAMRRDQLRESVTVQWWGTGLFLFGAALSGAANAAC